MNLPQDFKERMKHQLGDSYGDFLAAYDKERVYGLHYNPLKIKKHTLESALYAYQITLEPVNWAKEGFYYPADVQPGKLPLHEAGAYYIQEPSAMIAVELLDPKPGEKILDLCAAPGGKSTQIAGRMQGEGLFLSNEIIPARAKTLSRNIERMGIRNAIVLNETPKHLAERFPAFFDRILVDAPCSGEGMFRKNADACGEWSLHQVEICAKRQRDILSFAAEMLKPNGHLVYSTCTFAPQENEEIAAWFVQKYPQFCLQQSEHIWPHLQRGEGHYAAKFYKNAYYSFTDKEFLAANKTDYKKRKKTPRNGPLGNDNLQAANKAFTEFCQNVFSQKMQEQMSAWIQNGQLITFGEQLYLMPQGVDHLDGLKVERAGLQLGCYKKNRFEPAHALAAALHEEDVLQTLELDHPDCYINGEAVPCGEQKGWTLVTVQGCSIGWGKASQGILKNHYPKGLRKHY